MISYSAKSFSYENFLTLTLPFLKNMKKETLKIFSDFTRIEENFITELWENPYIVVNDISEIPKESRTSVRIIITYTIRKKNKVNDNRNIYYPYSLKLKTIFKITSKWLSGIYTPAEVVHGFVKGKSIRTNSEPHLESILLVKLDLKNFYEQIDYERIFNSLINLGVDEDKSKLISKICTINGNLVQGFSTSPVISNIVTNDLDIILQEYCLTQKINYSRYADDMSFSAMHHNIDINKIKELIEEFGYSINQEKTKILKRGFFQTVTGLTIFDNIRPRIPKRIKRNLRLEVYYINKYGIKNHSIRRLVKYGKYNKKTNAEEELKEEINRTRERIEGWINFTKGIEPEFSLKIKNLFEKRHDLKTLTNNR